MLIVYPEIGVLEVASIIFNDEGTIALLHNGDLFDDLLQVRIDRYLN